MEWKDSRIEKPIPHIIIKKGKNFDSGIRYPYLLSFKNCIVLGWAVEEIKNSFSYFYFRQQGFPPLENLFENCYWLDSIDLANKHINFHSFEKFLPF